MVWPLIKFKLSVLLIKNIPKPISINKTKSFYITQQTFINGQPLTLAQATLPKLKKALTILRPLYLKHKSQTKPYKTIIHGDLTHHNLIKSGPTLSLIDFDRHGFAFPEFDPLLFKVYKATYATQKPTYSKLFHNINQLLKSSDMPKEIKTLYLIVPQFKSNWNQASSIKKAFLQRMLTLSKQNL